MMGSPEMALMPPRRTLIANGRVDLKRIQRASRSVLSVLVSYSVSKWELEGEILTVNGHKATALQHHALRESLSIMCNIVKREVAQVGRKLIGLAVIRLPICQFIQILEREQDSRLGLYA